MRKLRSKPEEAKYGIALSEKEYSYLKARADKYEQSVEQYLEMMAFAAVRNIIPSGWEEAANSAMKALK